MKPISTELTLSIQDPGGLIRRLPLSESLWLGRDPQAPGLLRDSTLPSRAGTIQVREDHSVWMKAEESAPAFQVGDLEAREARLMEGVGVRWGESELRVIGAAAPMAPMPSFPSGSRPWHTCSPVGRKLLWDSRNAAKTPLSLYIEGETGTGKEVLAQLLHAWSDRASGPFVPLNCAALNLSLVESELFGHVKGAFTGAHQGRPGALIQAHNGTLFLDEIGDLPADIQVKLLRFLENGEIRPVGADSTSRASVRLICATHKPLLKLVEKGIFRRDLYYRLASVTLRIPPLRERPEDIDLLAREFASELGKSLTPTARIRLKSYSWPGNVRELRHTLERACALAGELHSVISEEALDFLIDAATESDAAESGIRLAGMPVLNLHEMERHLLLKALRVTSGNRTEAAKLLGVARSTLFEMLKRHRIDRKSTEARIY
jgi:transcriptional regulator with PAS, ATPase and Fis domain